MPAPEAPPSKEKAAHLLRPLPRHKKPCLLPSDAGQKEGSANLTFTIQHIEKKRKQNSKSVLSNFRSHVKTSMFFCFHILTQTHFTDKSDTVTNSQILHGS